MTINDFKAGDILLITYKTKFGYETRIGQVTLINYKNNGLVTYGPYYSNDFLPTGSSAFDPQNCCKKPFGTIAIHILENQKSRVETFQGPKPGDRGYDLMC